MKLEINIFGFSRRFILMTVYLFESLNILIFLPIFRILLPSMGILPAGASDAEQSQIFAWVFLSYYVAQIITAPIIGALTDLAGRKKSLLICLIVLTLGYFVSFTGIAAGSFWIICVGRVIKGAAANVRPIAIAAISDETPTFQDRIKTIAIFSTVEGVLGAIYLLNTKIEFIPSMEFSYFFFSGSLPFLVGALINLLLFFIIYIGFPEIYHPIREAKWRTHLFGFTRVLKQPKALRLFFLSFLISLTYLFIVQTEGNQSFSFSHEYHENILISGVLFAAGWIMSSGFLMPRLIDRYTIRQIMAIAFIAYAIFWMLHSFLIGPLAYDATLLAGGAIIGILWPSGISLISLISPEERQGRTQSVCHILFSLSHFFIPLAALLHPPFRAMILEIVAIALVFIGLAIVYSLNPRASNGH